MINRIFEALATFSDVAYMVWFIPAFLHVIETERHKALYLCSSGFDARFRILSRSFAAGL